GKDLWACLADGRVRSWALPGCKEGAYWRVVTKGEGTLSSAAFNSDASVLTVGYESGRTVICKTYDQSCQELPSVKKPIEALGVSPDGNLTCAGTRDGIVQVWRADGTPGPRLAAFGRSISSVLFHPDKPWLIASDRHGGTKVWDMATGELILTGSY